MPNPQSQSPHPIEREREREWSNSPLLSLKPQLQKDHHVHSWTNPKTNLLKDNGKYFQPKEHYLTCGLHIFSFLKKKRTNIYHLFSESNHSAFVHTVFNFDAHILPYQSIYATVY